MQPSKNVTYIFIAWNLTATVFFVLTFFSGYNQYSDPTAQDDCVLQLKEYNRGLSSLNYSVTKQFNRSERAFLKFIQCEQNMSTLSYHHEKIRAKLTKCEEDNLKLNYELEENKAKLSNCNDSVSKLRKCEENLKKLESNLNSSKAKTQNQKVIPKTPHARLKATDEPKMFRDILSSGTTRTELPGALPTTVHFVWCEKKVLKFEVFLGLLSIVRILSPLRLVFYYNYLPNEGGYFYYSWFYELRQSLPNLDLRKIDRVIKCNTMDAVDFALEQIASIGRGGFYFGERAVLTYIPEDWKTKNYFVYTKPNASSSEDTIVMIKQDQALKQEDLQLFKINVLRDPNQCHTPQEFDNWATVSSVLVNSTYVSPCVVLSSPMYPENILTNTSRFNAVLRWLYYGRTDGLYAKQSEDPSDLVPLINHMIFLNPKPGSPVVWSFEGYISVLSALYVGGFERVFVHGDTKPSGYWWDKLLHENVTFVYVDQPRSVFQQEVNIMAHRADILRVLLLYKYGGTYNDNDVIWVKPLSESQRRYPTIMCYDWGRVDPWPRTISNGLLVSKAGAPFLLKVLESFWYYRDDMWAFNSVLMFYKLYERHPDLVHIDPKLQVICYHNICHPIWHNNYLRGYEERTPTTRFNIEETNAFHFIHLYAPPIFTSFSAIGNQTSVVALLARRVMDAVQKAGKSYLLEEET